LYLHAKIYAREIYVSCQSKNVTLELGTMEYASRIYVSVSTMILLDGIAIDSTS